MKLSTKVNGFSSTEPGKKERFGCNNVQRFSAYLKCCSRLLFSQFFGLFNHFCEITSHVKGNFRQMILFTFEYSVEVFDSFDQGYVFAWGTSENFSNLEGLGQEFLDLSGTCDGQFVIFRQFIHTQNGNDILK